jgi:hypothetical protein
MRATIEFRIFCLPVSSLKTKKIKHKNLKLCLLLCIGVKLVSHSKGEYRWRVAENRLLRRTLEPKREEIARDWRRLRNEELHNLHTPPNFRVIKSRMDRWACSTNGSHEMKRRATQKT